MSEHKALPIPPKAEDDPESSEIFRAWVTSDGNLHVSLLPNIWPDHRTWGIFLSDVVQHVVQGICEMDEDKKPRLVSRDIVEMFRMEYRRPTDKAKGDFYS